MFKNTFRKKRFYKKRVKSKHLKRHRTKVKQTVEDIPDIRGLSVSVIHKKSVDIKWSAKLFYRLRRGGLEARKAWEVIFRRFERTVYYAKLSTKCRHELRRLYAWLEQPQILNEAKIISNVDNLFFCIYGIARKPVFLGVRGMEGYTIIEKSRDDVDSVRWVDFSWFCGKISRTDISYRCKNPTFIAVHAAIANLIFPAMYFVTDDVSYASRFGANLVGQTIRRGLVAVVPSVYDYLPLIYYDDEVDLMHSVRDLHDEIVIPRSWICWFSSKYVRKGKATVRFYSELIDIIRSYRKRSYTRISLLRPRQVGEKQGQEVRERFLFRSVRDICLFMSLPFVYKIIFHKNVVTICWTLLK